jgi:hypothetical protein
MEIASNLLAIGVSWKCLDLVEVEFPKKKNLKNLKSRPRRSPSLVGMADSDWKEVEGILTVRVP